MLRRKPRITPSTAANVTDADAAEFFDQHYGVSQGAYDPDADAWVVPLPRRGTGRLFRVFRREDGQSYIAVVLAREVN